MKLAASLTLALTLAALTYLAWASWRGFDPGMCEAYGMCEWRHS